jgi:hypothetical protein
MMTEEALAKISEGIIEVLVDNEESALNVSGFASERDVAEIQNEVDWKVRGCYTETAGVGSPIQSWRKEDPAADRRDRQLKEDGDEAMKDS